MRLIATADLHYNHPHSRRLADDLIDRINALPELDLLLLVGDTAVAEGDHLERCLSRFRFPGPKLFVAGNHELWTSGGDSYRIFNDELPRRIRNAGWHWLQTQPFICRNFALIGTIGWYDYSFRDEQLGIPLHTYERKFMLQPVPARWNDGRFVKLGRSDAAFLDELLANLEAQLRSVADKNHVIVATHHLPFAQLMPDMHGAQWRFVRAYLGTLLSVDDSVGRIYEALKDNWLLDRTVIIFTSDNGFALGEHGRVDKRTAYEESIRIPLLVRYPALAKAGTVINEMVLTHDLAPTIVDICGGEPLPKADGRSFKPLMSRPPRDFPPPPVLRERAGEGAGWRSAFFYQYNYEAQFPYTPNVRAVRTDQWKYIHYPHGDGGPDRYPPELYDLKSDPLEMKNLAADPAHAARVKELAALLEKLMREHDAIPDKMPIDAGIKTVLPKY
jgi:predicted phosphohydrolase